MATMMQPRTKREVNRLGLSTLRQSYLELADNYKNLLDLKEYLPCTKCGEWLIAEKGFYLDKSYFTERFPVCKKCILRMVEQREKDSDEPHETKESAQKVLRFMNKIYDDSYYEACVKHTYEDISERNKPSVFQSYMTAISSLPQFRGKTWADSVFGDSPDSVAEDDAEVRIVQKTIKNAKKIFGAGYKDEEYMFLMGQYEDWKARTQVDSKSQELYVTQICLQSLSIDKDRKAGNDVTNQLKALDTLMNSANLQPKQNLTNAATDSLTFSQLIAKWETEEPIPEPDPELCDVSNIGKNIRVWFAGWLGNALGLDVPQTKEYLDEVEKYTVRKPNSEEKESSAYIYNQIFGSDE